MGRNLPIRGIAPNLLQSSLSIENPSMSYDQPLPLPLFSRVGFSDQHILHNIVSPINKGEELTHVVVLIGASDQLVTTSKDIYNGLEPNHFTKVFKSRHECLLIGMQLA
jgi:hypothetical protein